MNGAYNGLPATGIRPHYNMESRANTARFRLEYRLKAVVKG